MNSPELLSPAGTLKNMRYAFAYGADAVYAGMPRYSLRVRNNDFNAENLAIGITEAHQQGKQFFVACNVMPHNSKLKTFMRDLAPVIEMKPDALIMADPGLIFLVREAWPEIPIHLSVQANTVNYAAVKFWQSVGIERVILSREISLDDIAEIRQQVPEMELEVFVHGALCIAYSGRCMLSGYFNHRDANQGTCTNSCRWDYKMSPAEEGVDGVWRPAEQEIVAPQPEARHPMADLPVFLEEPQRPGELMPVMEDEHGTYIMNSKDLRAVEHVHNLVKLGVNSLKIEGRTKSHYYAARTAQVYRRAIDDAVAGKPFNPQLLGILENLANRGYTDGFYQRHHTQAEQNLIESHSDSYKQRFVGEISAYDEETQLATIEVKNKFSVGDSLELLSPQGNQTFTLDQVWDLKGNDMNVVPGGGYRVKIKTPQVASTLDLLTINLT
ncbi:MAG: tRNA 5-hydroxyuridine modification protein YegQ [Gammaproteobacteria bacterium]|nr:tRNA 5-hydroxyuridine modification protein YegQ [Gammaproteobacteria bacterium]